MTTSVASSLSGPHGGPYGARPHGGSYVALLVCGTLVAGAAGLTGCKREGKDEANAAKAVVSVYCSIDEEFGRAVLDAFRESNGVELSVTFDSEAGKTTGLVQKIIAEAEAGRPRADVFWSSELFHTIRLARMGHLEPYDSPAAGDIPPRFRDPRHRWTALAARSRVLAFDPAKTSRGDVPTRWDDIARPDTAARTVIANPMFGTTCGHVAAMFALWGPARGRAFLTNLRDGGVHVADGNSAAVRALLAGRAAFAATDTDDVWVAQRSGASVDLTYPDMGDGGTLMVPCSVALVAGRPSNPAARQLVDFLVSAEVERLLAESDSRNVPVRASVRRQLDLEWPAETQVSFEAVVDAMDEATAAVREILLR